MGTAFGNVTHDFQSGALIVIDWRRFPATEFRRGSKRRQINKQKSASVVQQFKGPERHVSTGVGRHDASYAYRL